MRDVTDQRKAEHRSMTALQTAAASLDEGFVLFDQELKFVLCNDRYLELNFVDSDFAPDASMTARDFGYAAFDNDVVVLPDEMDRETFAEMSESMVRHFEKDVELSIEATCEGTTVSLAISDNGTGMPPEVQARIFEPFFTTKDVGAGTGFGLAFCHRIITSHNGELAVKSSQGAGTTFTISLCAVTDEEHALSRVRNQETAIYDILVVDDERDVAALLKAILEARGHSVECALGPYEALDRVEARSFDLVLSDMKMPRMMGDQLYGRIVELRPELTERVGFITGDSLSAKVRDFLKAGDRVFIEKPIQIEELLDLVERLGRFGGRTQ